MSEPLGFYQTVTKSAICVAGSVFLEFFWATKIELFGCLLHDRCVFSFFVTVTKCLTLMAKKACDRSMKLLDTLCPVRNQRETHAGTQLLLSQSGTPVNRIVPCTGSIFQLGILKSHQRRPEAFLLGYSSPLQVDMNYHRHKSEFCWQLGMKQQGRWKVWRRVLLWLTWPWQTLSSLSWWLSLKIELVFFFN